MLRRTILKRFMTAKRWAVEPRVGDLELRETFNHKIYREASEEERQALRLASAELRYKAEFLRPLDRSFGIDLVPLLEGGEMLDIGCFTGGKAAAYAERFRLRKSLRHRRVSGPCPGSAGVCGFSGNRCRVHLLLQGKTFRFQMPSSTQLSQPMSLSMYRAWRGPL